MNRKLLFSLLAWAALPVGAQQLLTLDSCRAMALRNNKQLSVSRVKQEVAANLRKSARTKYLPHVSALGGYEWTSKEVSILNDDQKSALSNLGTNLTGAIGQNIQQGMGNMPPGLWTALGNMGFTPKLYNSISATDSRSSAVCWMLVVSVSSMRSVLIRGICSQAL